MDRELLQKYIDRSDDVNIEKYLISSDDTRLKMAIIYYIKLYQKVINETSDKIEKRDLEKKLEVYYDILDEFGELFHYAKIENDEIYFNWNDNSIKRVAYLIEYAFEKDFAEEIKRIRKIQKEQEESIKKLQQPQRESKRIRRFQTDLEDEDNDLVATTDEEDE